MTTMTCQVPGAGGQRHGGRSMSDRGLSRKRVAELCAELGITPKALAVLRTAPARLDEWLTVEEICTELKVSRRTFDRWRATGSGPKCERLGGHGPLRSRRSWIEAWAESGEQGVA
jgi:predicted DNA-binding transcriptional regulator AlpA